ncbi:LysR family transcriptional regulator [Shewanella maritima]|uniref:LysR family transcriptional regulator n=1 Tax=Shewanella maritima TaxID=2520507 RepID=A0A411PGP6_9GAMM|nr:LysR family transcriptional regulator [Shewanella maritima]QBF82747.1 LysR family transcriptional regulator [Shewanella maritima]
MVTNLDYLAAFVAVYDSGGFAQAAAESKRHASTFSRKISALEDELGFEIFVRHGKSVEPTSQGHALYDHAKGLLVEADMFETKVQSIFSDHPANATIVIDSAINELGILEHISQLMCDYPSLKLTLKSGDTQSVRDMLINDEADIAFAMSTFSLPAAINHCTCFEFEFLRVATSEYLESHGWKPGEQVAPSTIRGMTQVILSPLREAGVESQVYSHQLINADNSRIAMELAKQGVGWCNVPKALCEAEIAAANLQAFSVESDYAGSWSVDMLWPVDKVYDPIRERLIELLR